MKRSSKRMRPVSEKRRSQFDERARVRAEVIERFGNRCAADGVPGVPHNHAPSPLPSSLLECNELKRGSNRGSTWLDPDWIVPLCRSAHEWCTVEGYPEPAVGLGLAARSWETDFQAVHDRRRLAGGL